MNAVPPPKTALAVLNLAVAFWYQQEPHAKFPKLPDKDKLEVN